MNYYTLLIVAFCCAYNFSLGQSFTYMEDSKKFQANLQSIAQKTTTLKSDFTQIKHLNVLSENIESNGKLYFKSESNLRWEYTAPLDYLIILRKGKVTIKDEGKVSSYDLSGNKTFQKINEMLISSIKGDLLVEQSDYKYEFKESLNSFLVIMLPKEKKVQEFFLDSENTFFRIIFSFFNVVTMKFCTGQNFSLGKESVPKPS